MASSDATLEVAAEDEAPDSRLYQLFDAEYYCRQVGDVETPLAHYLEFGWRDRRDPHPLFDTSYYLSRYELELGSLDPLSHFFLHGASRQYETHPLLDAAEYGKRHPYLAKSGTHPALHYLTSAAYHEPVSPFFDAVYYVAENPDIISAGFKPLVHYLAFGWRESRRPHREFDVEGYGRIVPAETELDPYSAFVRSLLAARSSGEGAPTRCPVDVTIIVLNYGKSLYTLQCLDFIARSKTRASYETIVVDNGSSDAQFALLAKFARNVRIVRLSENRFFGEANNIGAGLAAGSVLLFINNDAFVTEGAIDALLDMLASNPQAGAAGPKFLYLDGRLQEAGVVIAADGTAVQFGKGLDPENPMFNEPRTVHYCSAAALMVRKTLFDAVHGFDMCWDPAYYEDADLCLKLRLMGAATLYQPRAVVHHVENGTSADDRLSLKLHDIVGINRLKFISRWAEYLKSGDTTTVAALLPQTAGLLGAPPQIRGPMGAKRRLALYTPYPLLPGGGERYLLSLASTFRDEYHVTLLSPERYSTHRLATIARELSIDLGGVDHLPWSEAKASPYDVFIAMGNEVLPPVPGIGRLNLFHCQFPFPMHESHYARCWQFFADYAAVIVNSQFTAANYDKARHMLGLAPVPVHILNPPVPQYPWTPGERAATHDLGSILHIGRFAPGGHCKRQDTMIVAFQAALSLLPRGARLRLAGSLSATSEAREYLTKLQSLARGYPISFHINPTPAEIRALYQQAGVYWHVTGIGEDLTRDPARFEHFGITIAEAMSAGVIPIVLGAGGPAEIVSHGATGFLIEDALSLGLTTVGLQNLAPEKLASLRRDAAARAAEFSLDVFQRRAVALVAALDGRDRLDAVQPLRETAPKPRGSRRALGKAAAA